MAVRLVHIHVKPEHVDAFIEVTRTNHEGSVREPGDIATGIASAGAHPVPPVRVVCHRRGRRRIAKPHTSRPGSRPSATGSSSRALRQMSTSRCSRCPRDRGGPNSTTGASWQAPPLTSVNVPPATGTNCESHDPGRSVSFMTPYVVAFLTALFARTVPNGFSPIPPVPTTSCTMPWSGYGSAGRGHGQEPLVVVIVSREDELSARGLERRPDGRHRRLVTMPP